MSDVLLSTRSPALGTISGYSSQGNLFTGSGYWALQADMPMQLTDLQVRPDHVVSSIHYNGNGTRKAQYGCTFPVLIGCIIFAVM